VGQLVRCLEGGVILPLALGGQVLPVLLLPSLPWMTPLAGVLIVLAVVLLYSPRLVGMRRFQQSPLGTLLHPLGILVLLAIQWYGLGRAVLGGLASWKGRVYPPAGPKGTSMAS
jgi:hypothetical protein